MTNIELGMFEDDPRSVEGAQALAFLNAQIDTGIKTGMNPDWAAKDLLADSDDPREVATVAMVRGERSFDAYRQREAWIMQPGVEVTPDGTH